MNNEYIDITPVVQATGFLAKSDQGSPYHYYIKSGNFSYYFDRGLLANLGNLDDYLGYRFAITVRSILEPPSITPLFNEKAISLRNIFILT
ncbi:MAG: hypothetical protein LBI81_00530 [Puniceicoccales bacterium]|jgi:hypothetical protein|nr:hypothetical protein [Puniceicoccales bacterium]